MAQTRDDARTIDILAGVEAQDPAGAAPPLIEALTLIAERIGGTRRPALRKPAGDSAIPAGVTYLAQFAVHDLDFRGPGDVSGAPRLDLALIYGDGPRHDAFAYQMPEHPGEPRTRLRLGRARPTAASPAWGAARDLPRLACPHLDVHGEEARTEVLVPNTFSDSNLLLGQVQVLWALLHNAVVGGFAASMPAAEAFAAAQRVTRHVYRSVLIRDVLGGFVLPKLRDRYVREVPQRLSTVPVMRLPAVFQAGVARLGHALVRETYALNRERELEGLRGLIRHTSLGRPTEMPLTEDWLVDFARFFDIGDRKAQRARRIGPHVARPFALGGGVGLDAPSPGDGLVLRDLLACSRGGVPPVREILSRIRGADPAVLEGCFAQDEIGWQDAVGAWLEEAGVSGAAARTLRADPPLILFLMLEAERDAEGQSLGCLGSILMAETLAGALPAPAPEEDLKRAEKAVFDGPLPGTMADVIVYLQAHHRFADGARLHSADATRHLSHAKPTETPMLDERSSNAAAAGLVEVADYIELGRLVTDWTFHPETRPKDIRELVSQLDGIAKVPSTFKAVEFHDGKPDVLVIRLPEKELLQSTLKDMESPVSSNRYMLPQFYDDIYSRNFGPQMTPLDTFLARVGDYTIAQCK